MTTNDFLIYALATWRVASLLVHEGGPGSMFRGLRELVGITHDDQGNHLIVPETFLGGVFSCVWCASVWVGLGWMVADQAFPALGLFGATVMALSAVAVMVERWVRG